MAGTHNCWRPPLDYFGAQADRQANPERIILLAWINVIMGTRYYPRRQHSRSGGSCIG